MSIVDSANMCSLKCTSYVKLPWVSPVGVWGCCPGSPFFGPKKGSEPRRWREENRRADESPWTVAQALRPALQPAPSASMPVPLHRRRQRQHCNLQRLQRCMGTCMSNSDSDSSIFETSLKILQRCLNWDFESLWDPFTAQGLLRQGHNPVL